MWNSKVLLGEGTYGKVYKVSRGEQEYALKEFRDENFFSEVSLALQCDHPNIVKAFDYGEDYMLMEAGQHDLQMEITREKPSEAKVLSWLPHMFSALVYLHQNKIAHGDVKDTNFVLREDGSLFLCDLGSCAYQTRENITRFNPTTLLSPQGYGYLEDEKVYSDIFGEEENKYASDAWSLGVTLIRLLTGIYPFFSRDPLSEYTRYIDNPLAFLFSLCLPPSLIPLLQTLLSPRQKKRCNLRRIAEKFSIPLTEGRREIFKRCPVTPDSNLHIQAYKSYSPSLSSTALLFYNKVKSLDFGQSVTERKLSYACLFLASSVCDSSMLADDIPEHRELAFIIFQRLSGELYLC